MQGEVQPAHAPAFTAGPGVLAAFSFPSATTLLRAARSLRNDLASTYSRLTSRLTMALLTMRHAALGRK